MYFHAVSVSPLPRGALVALGLTADRLAVQLPQFADWLHHAAAVATADWVGPHRDEFDRRVRLLTAALLSARATVAAVGSTADDLVHASP